MYQVFRNKRVVSSIPAQTTYEKARQALRKLIRSRVRKGHFDKAAFNGSFVAWDEISRNPVNFTDAGYRIRKVA